MTNNTALDVAIGLILMYLMLSLLCTVVNEFIATQLNLRAKTLAAALEEILDNKTVRAAFYDHGLISGTKTALQKASTMLHRSTVPFVSNPVTAATPEATPATRTGPATDRPAAPPAGEALAAAVVMPAEANAVAPADARAATMQPGEHPSYISAEVFVQALIGGLVGTRVAPGQPIPTFAEIQSTIEKLPASNIKSALVSSLVVAQGDLDAFRKSVATWFDDSMERLSGAYKRYMKWISIAIGLAVAVAFNADTFGVASALWKDQALRDRVVTEATNVIQKSGTTNGVCKVETPATKPADQNTATTVNLDQMQKSVTATEDCLRPFPIGWTSASKASWTSWSPLAWPWLAIMGWFVTALALSLGAPFWFDLLSKFVNIRGGGPKPQRANATG